MNSVRITNASNLTPFSPMPFKTSPRGGWFNLLSMYVPLCSHGFRAFPSHLWRWGGEDAAGDLGCYPGLGSVLLPSEEARTELMCCHVSPRHSRRGICPTQSHDSGLALIFSLCRIPALHSSWQAAALLQLLPAPRVSRSELPVGVTSLHQAAAGRWFSSSEPAASSGARVITN